MQNCPEQRDTAACGDQRAAVQQPVAHDKATLGVLAEIARQHGTPTYAFDVRRVRAQVDKLRAALPEAVDVLYSLKANASLGICDVLADCGIGADVASAGELATAVAAGFADERIFVAGPFKLPETIAQLRRLPRAVISVDSPSELQMLAEQGLSHRAVLRLRPDFGSEAVVAAGSECRFGFTQEDLPGCRELVQGGGLDVIGFHIFAGSQVLQAAGVIEHLRRSFDLALRTADTLGIEPELLNLGGGFGILYASCGQELDLAPVGAELAALSAQAPGVRLVLELGRYLVAQAGWYLTRVVGQQTNQGRPAVIVDGGTHQRTDFCGLCLRTNAAPPVALGVEAETLSATDVLGCLSLPADVLAEGSLLPRLAPGDVLAFANAGAYGIWSAPALFHAATLPAEVAFDGETVQVMRARRDAASILDDQQHVAPRGAAAPV